MNQVAVKEREPQGQAIALATPMDMLGAALERGAGIDVVEKLMALQERWEKNQGRKAFDEAIAAAKAEIQPVARNATGHNLKKYADFAAIARAVDPIISKHGLSYRFRTTQTDRISVTCVLSHRDGHSEETTLVGPADATGNKNAIQAIGSTLTYLQRYSLVQMLGIAVGEDDDGKSAATSETITQEQADNLRDLIEANGKKLPAFLKWAKVEKLEAVPVANYQACVDAANFKKPVQS